MSSEPEVTTEEQSEVYMCSGCGGTMEFSINAQKLKCPYCGAEQEIRSPGSGVKEFDFAAMVKREQSHEWDGDVSVVRCESCGGQTVVEKHQTALACCYCGSSKVLDAKQSAGIKPEGIVPFQIDKNTATAAFEKWIRKRWLAPNKLKKYYQSEKLIPVYIPYWTYDAQTFNEYSAEGGQHYYVTVTRNGKRERQRRTRWFHVHGRFNRFFDDVLVNASSTYDRSLMKKIEPFDTSRLEPYKPQYLSGYLSERYSIGVKDGFENAKEIIHTALVADVATQVRRKYDEVRNIHVHTVYDDVTCKHVLLPVWTAQYDFNGKKYRYILNAQTGKIAGKSPLSPWKIAILVALGLIAAGVVMYLLYINGYFNG